MLSVRDLSNGRLLGIVRTSCETSALGNNIVVEEIEVPFEILDNTKHDPRNAGRACTGF